VLAPRLVPHLVHLCTHKVAYLTVLKIINQRNEPEARDLILRALFFSSDDKVLEEILADQTSGATLIFKILTTPFFEEDMRGEVVKNVRNVLSRLKANSAQGYKRLMDEVGLAARNGNKADHQSATVTPYAERSRPASQQGGPRGGAYIQQSPMSQNNGQFAASYNTPPGHENGYADFNGGYPGVSQQGHYQQALLANSTRGLSPANAYNAYPSPAPSYDNYRLSQTPPIGMPVGGGPMLGGGPGYPSPAFSPVPNGGNMGTFGGYSQVPQQYYAQQQMGQQGGGRRGRVSSLLDKSSCRD